MNDLEEDTLPKGGSWWVRSLGSKSSKKRARQYEKREDQGQLLEGEMRMKTAENM